MRNGAGGIDTSNMGRCVRCGETVDMRDERDGLVIMEQNDPDHPDVNVDDVREAMAQAIRRSGNPEDEPLAVAYEDGEEIVLHEECHDESALPDMYAENWETEGDEDE